jgi:hypothetical protein
MRFMVLLLAACSTEIAIAPQGGLEAAVSAPGPVTLTAFYTQWSGSPDDLTDYITPVAVELYNPSPYEVRVSYADFSLRDERGFRYSAINPFLPNQLGQIDAPVMLASRGGGGGGGGGRGGGGFHGGGARPSSSGGWHGVSVGPPGGRRGGYGYGYGRGGWHGYSIYGGAHAFYPGWPWWRDPFLYPVSPWVLMWGPGYYPSDQPSRDVVEQALPEGVLSPGGRVNGYLYFQKATDRGKSLLLGWEAHEIRYNGLIGNASVALQVIER